jgi:hypothetical protein
MIVLNVKKSGDQTDKLLDALRLDSERHAKVSGPDKDGRVVVHDDEAREGEARERLVQSLDSADPTWGTLLDIQPPHESESAAWVRRQQGKDTRRRDKGLLGARSNETSSIILELLSEPACRHVIVLGTLTVSESSRMDSRG